MSLPWIVGLHYCYWRIVSVCFLFGLSLCLPWYIVDLMDSEFSILSLNYYLLSFGLNLLYLSLLVDLTSG